MMGELGNFFDTYSLNARVKPAFFLVFPVVITIFTLFEPSRTWGGAVTTFIISFGIISFASNQMSTKGNILQEKFFLKWGGAPTTLILRHRDSRLDPHTKNRYMTALEALIPNFTAFSVEEEEKHPAQADDMYRTAANYMREHTRDSKKYPLIFKENIAYGFSRNVRAFKWFGITNSTLSLGVTCFVIWYRHIKNSTSDVLDLIFSIPFESIALVSALILMTLLWIFIVTEKWVEVRAFAYARALFAGCEKQT
ncbi:TPA: hypothetical protein ACX6R7_003493 [Photobacterium damselae]